MCVQGECMHFMAHVWRSEDNLWELDLSLHHVVPRDRTQVIRLGNKCLNLLNQITDLPEEF